MRTLSPLTNVALIFLGFVLCTLRDLAAAVAATAVIILLVYGALDTFLPWALMCVGL